MKNITLLFILFLSFNSFAATFKSDIGFSINLSDDWYALSKKQASKAYEKETLKSLELLNINDKKLKAILKRVKAGNIEFIFDKKFSTNDFKNNISIQTGAGTTARTKEQGKIACKSLTADLKKLYKKNISVSQCGMKTIDTIMYMSYEYKGAVADISTVQNEFQLTPNLTIITVGGALPIALKHVKNTQNRIAAAIASHIKKSPNYFNVMNKANKFLKKEQYKSAYKQFMILANVNDPEGLFNIARFNEYGKGTKTDLKKALSYYKKSAQLGSRISITKLGDFYMNGKGTKKDLNKAAKLFYQSGLMGDPVAQHIFATMLFNGIGVKEKKPQEAIKWLQESAKQGYPPAAKTLFQIFETGAKNNKPGAKHGLAMMYLQGVGVKPDSAKAIKLLEQSAFDGAKASREALYKIYSNGMFGVPKNIEKAKVWKQE